jgi:glyceraldehyde 3-phosphate dehydrogenase
VTVLNKKTSIEEVNAAMKAAANESFRLYRRRNRQLRRDRHPVSALSTTPPKPASSPTATTKLVKTVSWYDNEMSYVSQLVRSLHYFAKLISK